MKWMYKIMAHKFYINMYLTISYWERDSRFMDCVNILPKLNMNQPIYQLYPLTSPYFNG
jgi:hypothetical protein